MEIAVLALGCFWGPEIKFSKIKGIIKTEVGYCGGNSSKTTYKDPGNPMEAVAPMAVLSV